MRSFQGHKLRFDAHGWAHCRFCYRDTSTGPDWLRTYCVGASPEAEDESGAFEAAAATQEENKIRRNSDLDERFVAGWRAAEARQEGRIERILEAEKLLSDVLAAITAFSAGLKEIDGAEIEQAGP